MKISTNRFSVLSEYDSDEEFIFQFPSKITHLELHPIAKIIKYKNVSQLEPHPTSYLIKYICICKFILYKNKVSFNDCLYVWDFKHRCKNGSYYIQRRNEDAYHDDILLQSEIDNLKRQYESSKEKLKKIKDEVYENTWELNEKIYKIKNECNIMCVKWLDQIHICTCKNCYHCENTDGIDRFDLGRCRHYYEIERIKEDIDYQEEYIDDYTKIYWDIESRYKRELAKKEKSLDEYQQQLDEDFDDWSFEESMRYSNYQRYYKEPVYIY
jgi:hypothetical protein